jgi:hypothetical protein
MSNPWFRMYSEFANDPKVQMLSETDQRRLVMLFCFRCNGHVTLQDEEVTFQLRISPEEWAKTKAQFIAKGFIDESNNVLNWDKRQYKSDSSLERVRRHREAKKQDDVTPCNVSVTVQNRTDTEQIQNRKKELEGAREETRSDAAIKKIKVSRASRLPDDWELPQEWGDWAETKGLSGDEIIAQAEKFKARQKSKGASYIDWESTWHTWVLNYIEWSAKNVQAKTKY